MTASVRRKRLSPAAISTMFALCLGLSAANVARAQSTGACCLTNGDCVSMSELSCETIALGSYQGDGVDCGVANCHPTLVINEIDYDQETSVDAAEFIELKNTGAGPLNLDAYAVVLVNGDDNAIYRTIELPDVDLAAGDYFVICANGATVPNCDLDASPDTNMIQNGAPDAVAIIRNTPTRGFDVIDALSYEGLVAAPWNEGDGFTLSDPAVFELGLSRYPDGVDTNNSAADFSRRCVTPGQPNIAQSEQCGLFRGACCYDDVCMDAVTILACRETGGRFGGDDSLCADIDCGAVGACCRDDGVCEIALGVNCVATGETYFGDGTDCTGINCLIGACCLTNGSCDEVTEASCTNDGGTWSGASTACAGVTCVQPTAACCYVDGTCADVTDTECTGGDGVWRGFGTACATTKCEPVVAACCLDNGSCESATLASCDADGGTWLGAGSECATAQCVQPAAACCFGDGSCQEMTDTECTAASGSWQGFGSDCASADCPQTQPTVGACCAGDGSCTEVEEASCGGTYKGDGTTCANAGCTTPTPNPQPNDNGNTNTNDNTNGNDNSNDNGNTNDNQNDNAEPEPQTTPDTGCFPVFFLFQTLFGIPLCGPCVVISAVGTFVGIIGMKRRLRRTRRTQR